MWTHCFICEDTFSSNSTLSSNMDLYCHQLSPYFQTCLDARNHKNMFYVWCKNHWNYNHCREGSSIKEYIEGTFIRGYRRMGGVLSLDNSLCWNDQLRASLFLALVYFLRYSEKKVRKFCSVHHKFTQTVPGQNLVTRWWQHPAQIVNLLLPVCFAVRLTCVMTLMFSISSTLRPVSLHALFFW
jgi:hypothetical protein